MLLKTIFSVALLAAPCALANPTPNEVPTTIERRQKPDMCSPWTDCNSQLVKSKYRLCAKFRGEVHVLFFELQDVQVNQGGWKSMPFGWQVQALVNKKEGWGKTGKSETPNMSEELSRVTIEPNKKQQVKGDVRLFLENVEGFSTTCQMNTEF
ncbi:hypothetical protein LOZ66_003250 [Ophidiomyces ophidiicola]|nr:hypothetical protein LOZ66_003250 [Ophidiomyces ophidiicola]